MGKGSWLWLGLGDCEDGGMDSQYSGSQYVVLMFEKYQIWREQKEYKSVLQIQC